MQVSRHISPAEYGSRFQSRLYKSCLLQEYAKELAQLLVKLGDLVQPDAQLQQRLQQVTIESSRLMGIIKRLNIEVYKAVLQNGVAPPLLDGQMGLTDEWYSGSEVRCCHAVTKGSVPVTSGQELHSL